MNKKSENFFHEILKIFFEKFFKILFFYKSKNPKFKNQIKSKFKLMKNNNFNLGNLMKQAQAMQENLKKSQEALAKKEVEGQAGAGMVKILMTCGHEVKRVTIDDSVMDDKEMLEDLIAAAFNDAMRRAEEATQSEMAGLAGGIPLPPGFKFPFSNLFLIIIFNNYF